MQLETLGDSKGRMKRKQMVQHTRSDDLGYDKELELYYCKNCEHYFIDNELEENNFVCPDCKHFFKDLRQLYEQNELVKMVSELSRKKIPKYEWGIISHGKHEEGNNSTNEE